MSFFLKYVMALVILSVMTSVCLYSQQPYRGSYRVMFYNVENLFDIYDDQSTDDDDFTPGGLMRWNGYRYMKKINSLYKTIVAAGGWEIPAIIAMCEIENRMVVEDLIFKTNLAKYSPGIVHEDSPDGRGIDVCLIYDRDKVSLLSYRYLIPATDHGTTFKTRSVLYSTFLIAGDTLHVLVNHWPSRRGGSLAGKDLRIRISRMVRELCDSIAARSQGKILVCGDFNAVSSDEEILILSGYNRPGALINISSRMISENYGTYRYRGVWEMIDQILISESLLLKKGGLFTTETALKIFNEDFLLENDPVYPGSSPFSTYRGFRYHGGFSDHLPVFIDLFNRQD